MQVLNANIFLYDKYMSILVKDFVHDYDKTVRMINLEEVVQMMNEVFTMRDRAEEYVYLIALDTKLNLICFFELLHGTHNKTAISVRELFIRVLLCGAVNLLIIHNYPSGDAEPSEEEYDTTVHIKRELIFWDYIFVTISL